MDTPVWISARLVHDISGKRITSLFLDSKALFTLVTNYSSLS